jgi:hypothetical protein
MTQEEIRVGVVGANAKAGWAKLSHGPAIKGLPGLKLTARLIEAVRRAAKRGERQETNPRPSTGGSAIARSSRR